MLWRAVFIFSLLAMMPPLAWAGDKGHHFYLRWNEEARVACQQAVLRILSPYTPIAPLLTLEEETLKQTDHYARVILNRPEAVDSFPSLRSAEVKARVQASPQPPNLAEFFPAVVREPIMHERHSSANCYGGAFAWFGISNQYFYVDPLEVDPLLKKYFKRVRRGTALTPETLVLWRYAHDKEPVHAAILLDEHTIWHRGGSNAATFTYLEKAVNSYGGRNGGRRDAIIEFYLPNWKI